MGSGGCSGVDGGSGAWVGAAEGARAGMRRSAVVPFHSMRSAAGREGEEGKGKTAGGTIDEPAQLPHPLPPARR